MQLILYFLCFYLIYLMIHVVCLLVSDSICAIRSFQYVFNKHFTSPALDFFKIWPAVYLSSTPLLYSHRIKILLSGDLVLSKSCDVH